MQIVDAILVPIDSNESIEKGDLIKCVKAPSDLMSEYIHLNQFSFCVFDPDESTRTAVWKKQYLYLTVAEEIEMYDIYLDTYKNEISFRTSSRVKAGERYKKVLATTDPTYRYKLPTLPNHIILGFERSQGKNDTIKTENKVKDDKLICEFVVNRTFTYTNMRDAFLAGTNWNFMGKSAFVQFHEWIDKYIKTER